MGAMSVFAQDKKKTTLYFVIYLLKEPFSLYGTVSSKEPFYGYTRDPTHKIIALFTCI